MQSYVHTTEEDRAEYFRQWGRQLDKETTVLREAVGALMPKTPSDIMHSLSTACHTTGASAVASALLSKVFQRLKRSCQHEEIVALQRQVAQGVSGGQDVHAGVLDVSQVRDYEESAAGARAREDAASMAPAQEVIRQWYPAVTRRLEQEQQEARAGSSDTAAHTRQPQHGVTVFSHPSLEGHLPRMAARETGCADTAW